MNYSESNQHHHFLFSDWRAEAAAGDTSLGYHEWVEHQVEEKRHDLAHTLQVARLSGSTQGLTEGINELLRIIHPPLEIGCHFDGCHGQAYNNKRVVELAREYGMPDLPDFPSFDDSDEAEHYLEQARAEHEGMSSKEAFRQAESMYNEHIDEQLAEHEPDATEYLEQFAPEGHYAGWYDGDFGVWPNEEDEQENAYKVTAWDDTDNVYYIGTSKDEAEAHLAKRTTAGQGARLYSCYDDGNTSMSEWEIQDWNCDLDTGILTPADTSPLGEPRTCRELQGEEYTLIQNEQDLASVAEHIDWPALKNHTFIEKSDLTAAIVAIGDGEYTDIWGCVEAGPYVLSATYYRLL